MNASSMLAGAASLFIAGTASAGMVVEFPSTIMIPANNDFRGYLNGLELDVYASGGASISFDRAGTLTFEYLGSESGYRDRFHYAELVATEDNDTSLALEPMFSVSIDGPGAFAGYFTSSGRGASVFGPGTEEFGIFLNADTLSGWNSNVLWLGLDDQIGSDDNDHDDFIIKATFTPLDVPEPGMIGLLGLGLAGIGMARRRR